MLTLLVSNIYSLQNAKTAIFVYSNYYKLVVLL